MFSLGHLRSRAAFAVLVFFLLSGIVNALPETRAAAVGINKLYCKDKNMRLLPGCATASMKQLSCLPGAKNASIPLPYCWKFTRYNVKSLSSLLCRNTPQYLPSCITLTKSQVAQSGGYSASKLGSGTLPSNVKIAPGSVSSLSVSKLSGALGTSNTVSSANMLAGSIYLNRLAKGALPSQSTMTGSNIQGSLALSVLAAGTLKAGVVVGNNNLANGSISPTALSSGALPSTITVTSANLNGLLTVDRLGCGSTATVTTLGCVGANVEKLVCSNGNVTLNSCITATGSQITGGISASQITGALSGAASISPSRLTCPSNDSQSLPTCMSASVESNVVCPNGGSKKELPCIGIDGSQVYGAINAAVSGSLVEGDLDNPSFRVDGKNIQSHTFGGSKFSGSTLRYTYQSVKGGIAYTMQTCCDAGERLLSCQPPMPQSSETGPTQVVVYTSNLGYTLQLGSSCCRYTGVQTGVQNGANVVMSIVCLNPV